MGVLASRDSRSGRRGALACVRPLPRDKLATVRCCQTSGTPVELAKRSRAASRGRLRSRPRPAGSPKPPASRAKSALRYNAARPDSLFQIDSMRANETLHT